MQKKETIIVSNFDINNPPPLTKKEQEELEVLKLMSDDDIDFSDIPEMSQDNWDDAMKNKWNSSRKTINSIQLDKDIMNWFKPQKGYQKKINEILRDYINQHIKARRLG